MEDAFFGTILSSLGEFPSCIALLVKVMGGLDAAAALSLQAVLRQRLKSSRVIAFSHRRLREEVTALVLRRIAKVYSD